MQYKNTKKIILDQRKLETLFRIGCPDNLIIELLKTGTFTPTGDSLIDDNLESLIDHKLFNNENWGGKRAGAGRPKNNQDKNQDEIQVEIQDRNQDTDKYIDIYNNTRNSNKGGVGGKEKGEFVPPTLEEVLEYARQQNSFAGVGGFACTPEQAEEFWSYYESQGWRIGNDSNTPIRDWKPKLRQWHIKAKQVSMKQATKSIPRMSYKEMKEMQNEIEVQKILNGER